ncbi:MAB_1171c family putative transporter [Streptomyces kronopolitis]
MSRHLGAAAVALVWVIVLWRAPAAVKVPRSRALWAGFCTLAAALTVRLPPVQRTVESPPGTESLTLLIMHLLGLAAIGFLLRWIRLMGVGEGIRTLPPRLDILLTAAVATTMTALFLLADRTGRPTPFPLHTPHDVPATAYLWLWFAYLGAAMIRAAVLFCSGYRRTTKGLLRTGLAITAAGFLLGVLYALLRLIFLTGYRPGALASDTASEEAAHTLQFTSVLLIGLGTSLPVGNLLLRRLEQYRRLHELRSLWSPLVEAAPHVVLGTPPSRLDDLLSVRNLELRLHRRVIEIRDAALALRTHIPHTLPDRAQTAAASHGLSGPEQDAAVHAFCLRHAVHASLSSQPPPQTPTTCLPDAPDSTTESAWLTRIRTAYHSPTMGTIDRLLAHPSTSSCPAPASSTPSPTGPQETE